MMKKSTPIKWLLGSFAIIFMLVEGIPFLISTIFLHSQPEWQGPSSGLWYCEDLQIQLCFQIDSETFDPENGQADTRCYALIDNRPVMCNVRIEQIGSYDLCVTNQDLYDVSDLGDSIFEGEHVSLDAKDYVVRRKDGSIFTFRRVEEFSLDEKLEKYQKQIDAYGGVQAVEETPHIAIAVQAAKTLWDTELGIDATKIKTIVAFDLETNCWFVFADFGSSPAALIETNGNVIGVFSTTDGSVD